MGISEDDNANLGSLDPSFEGMRFLIGGDARWTRDHLLVSGEVIYASLDPEFGPTTHPFGFHATAGYMLNPKTQVLARLDSFDPDGLQDDSHLIVLGLNHWPTQATEVQVNYVIPTEDGGIDHNQILINAQVSF